MERTRNCLSPRSHADPCRRDFYYYCPATCGYFKIKPVISAFIKFLNPVYQNFRFPFAIRSCYGRTATSGRLCRIRQARHWISNFSEEDYRD